MTLLDALRRRLEREAAGEGHEDEMPFGEEPIDADEALRRLHEEPDDDQPKGWRS